MLHQPTREQQPLVVGALPFAETPAGQTASRLQQPGDLLLAEAFQEKGAYSPRGVVAAP